MSEQLLKLRDTSCQVDIPRLVIGRIKSTAVESANSTKKLNVFCCWPRRLLGMHDVNAPKIKAPGVRRTPDDDENNYSSNPFRPTPSAFPETSCFRHFYAVTRAFRSSQRTCGLKQGILWPLKPCRSTRKRGRRSCPLTGLPRCACQVERAMSDVE